MGTSGKMAAIVIGLAVVLVIWLGISKIIKKG
jgi:spore maturation protein SpmA